MGNTKRSPKPEPLERKRQRFSKEFKLAAIGLLKQGQRSATQIALELGIRRNQLYKWAAELEEKAGDAQAVFNGPGRKAISQQSEIERLRREVARLTEERDILKKAAASRLGRALHASRKSCREVRVCASTQGYTWDCGALPKPWCLSKRLLRMA
jgi:transposase